MGTVDDLILLTEVVDAGSMSAASRRTGIPKSTLSRRLDDLETELGLHLLVRGSRNFSATEIGRSISERGQRIRDELVAIRSMAERSTKHPAGQLRIPCPVVLTEVLVGDFAVKFAKTYPDVRVALDTTGGSFAPVIEDYDLAIQPARGMLANSNLVHQKLATAPYCLVAAPEVGRSLGNLSGPADLKQCPAIGWSADGFASRWKIVNGAGRSTIINVDVQFSGNNLNVIRRAALGGLGLARLPERLCAADLREGRLMLPLPNWRPPLVTICALYPSRKSLTLAARLFVTELKQHLKEESNPEIKMLAAYSSGLSVPTHPSPQKKSRPRRGGSSWGEPDRD
jgi:DNA-binding transcriptional LysR family regulator